ncbi:MAG: NAD(+) diphosphatase [Bacteroidaceae bacterium]|nr:NAD(+) diphosphatase [Bacteroidaceae bacterium]
MKHCYIFFKDKLILQRAINNEFTIPDETVINALSLKAAEEIEVKMSDGEICSAIRLDTEITENDNFAMIPLRQSYFHIPNGMYHKAGKAYELLYWSRNHRYCGVCGGEMAFSTDISKKCVCCGNEIWPSLAIAIIVLIRKGDEILLVHAHNFRGNFYGLIAGFVETGESLEQCVMREVKEETGLSIKNVQYFKSQPWPYPCGLMAGFFADYESGELKLQEEELASGGWFTRNNMPEIPPKLSMARMLIDKWLEE